MKKILVIENETRTRDLFLTCLDAEGFYTIGAENGLLGLQQAQEQLPDLIICNIDIPELNGYGVLSTLRQAPFTAVIPFILVTAKITRADLRKGMELGVDGYLAKPCTKDELLRAIAARLEKQTALQQWYSAKSQQVLEPLLADAAKAVKPEHIFPSITHLRKVFDFIEANYHLQITLYDVAQAVGYSPAYLTNLMRRQTGQTLYRWIIKRRMAQARYLLLVTSQSVQKVAEAVGYLDSGHFIQQFRRLNGVSPQAWRRAHRS